MSDIKYNPSLLLFKSYPSLPAVGFKQHTPQKWAGILRLPPISLPQPSIDASAPSAHPSPPDDPPGPRFKLKGFSVVP